VVPETCWASNTDTLQKNRKNCNVITARVIADGSLLTLSWFRDYKICLLRTWDHNTTVHSSIVVLRVMILLSLEIVRFQPWTSGQNFSPEIFLGQVPRWLYYNPQQATIRNVICWIKNYCKTRCQYTNVSLPNIPSTVSHTQHNIVTEYTCIP
jgi:hypothetical protein